MTNKGVSLFTHKLNNKFIEYRDVADGDEFVALSCEEVIRLISSDKLTVPTEEKVKQN